jgi:hypothetical protein
MITVIAGILLVATATSLGWGLRGVWGHWWGATVPGAFCGMAIWLAFGETHDIWQVLLFGAVLALSLTMGGKLSYIRLVGFVRTRAVTTPMNPPVRKDMFGEETDTHLDRSPLFGLFGVFLVGGLWGYFGGVALGLLMTDVAYTFSDLALWGILASLGGYLSYKLLVIGFGWRLSPPKKDNWAAMLGGCLATTIFFALGPRDAIVLRTAFLGFLGFGGGFVPGALIYRRCVVAGWTVDSWKFMEHCVGFFGGLALAVSAVLMERDLVAVPTSTTARLVSALVVVWLVPYLSLATNFISWLNHRMVSPRAYAAFHVAGAGSLVALVAIFPAMIDGLEGESMHFWPFAGLIVFLTFAAHIINYRSILKLTVTRTTFIVMAVICLLLLVPIL